METLTSACTESASHSRNKEDQFHVRNVHLHTIQNDNLYHLSLQNGRDDLVEMFGDVKFVCIGGKPSRMKQFACYMKDLLQYQLPVGVQLFDISGHEERYSMYKIGPILSVSHGMGAPSVSILLHELFKLLTYAKVTDPIFFRIGTCGGIGLEPGTVVVSKSVQDARGANYYELPILGKPVRRCATLDKNVQRELMSLKCDVTPATGITMCTDDFYEGQGRLDGAFCDYTEESKMTYLESLHVKGVRNIEMESLVFAALTHHAGIKAAVVCVTLLDRLKGDQVVMSSDDKRDWDFKAQRLVGAYIQKKLGKQNIYA